MPRKILHIGQKDFMLANRKAARQEEIDAHGKQIAFRVLKHRSKKQYKRQRDKKVPED